MREIIFRGKDVKENWHIGLLSHIGNAWYISNQGCLTTAYEVIPSTIGQYTGFDDKNGKMVFEGDILKAEIWWEQGGCYPHTETRFIEATFPNMYKNHFEKFEVVGNIYDNPELLRR